MTALGAELFDVYVVSGVTTEEIASMDIELLVQQIHELRKDDRAEEKPDPDLTDHEIASAILEYAKADATQD